MMLVQLIVKRHLNCWVSEVSAKYPSYQFLSMLSGINQNVSQVFLYIKPNDGNHNEQMEETIVADIATIGIKQGLSINRIEPKHVYQISVSDVGSAEEIIRLVLDRMRHGETFFPQYQSMLSQNGSEFTYAVFRSQKDLEKLYEQMAFRIGADNIEFKIVNPDIRPEDVKNSIPCWYDEVLPPEVAKALRETFDDPDPEKSISRFMDKLVDLGLDYYWVVPVILHILANLFGSKFP